MVKNFQIIVFGKVQGVGYRLSALKQAKIRGVKGYVKNNYCDGSVIIEAEGDEENLYNFIDWCRKGPTMAKVVDIIVKDSSMKEFSDFDIY